jgi:hypothetical protein
MALKHNGLKALRWVIWILMAFLLVRGIVSLLPRSPAAAAQPAEPSVQAIPEPNGLRAFPAMFAREYFTFHVGKGEEDRAERLRPYLARSLDRQAGWKGSAEPISQRAEDSWFYSVKQLSPTRWLVTVAVKVVRQQERVEHGVDGQYRTVREDLPDATLLLAVPVATSADGGLVVYQLPALVPGPAAAEFTEPRAFGQPTTDKDDRVRSLVTGFFRAYFDPAGDVTYYLAPGAEVHALRNRWTYEQLAGVELLTTDDGPWALAEVQVSDPVTSARYTLTYTLDLVEREGRWYIEDLVQKGE